MPNVHALLHYVLEAVLACGAVLGQLAATMTSAIAYWLGRARDGLLGQRTDDARKTNLVRRTTSQTHGLSIARHALGPYATRTPFITRVVDGTVVARARVSIAGVLGARD